MRKHRILFAQPAARLSSVYPQNVGALVDKMVEKVAADRLDRVKALWYNDPRRQKPAAKNERPVRVARLNGTLTTAEW